MTKFLVSKNIFGQQSTPVFRDTIPAGYVTVEPPDSLPPLEDRELILATDDNGAYLKPLKAEWRALPSPAPIIPGADIASLFHALDHRRLYHPDTTPQTLTTEDGIARNESGDICSPNYAAFLRFKSDPTNGIDPAISIALSDAFGAVSTLLVEAKNWQETQSQPADTGRLAVSIAQLFLVMPEELGETTKTDLTTEINALLSFFNMGFSV